MSERGFTLIEVMVAITVFTLVMIAAGGSFISAQYSWQRQRVTLDNIQRSRWAMDFISNEIRQAGNIFEGPESFAGESIDVLRFERDTDGNPDNGSEITVRYWRGNGYNLGDRDKLYRGEGTGLGLANGNRQELADFVVDNPEETPGNPYSIFDESAGVVTIWLTVERDNRTYTMKTKVRSRN